MKATQFQINIIANACVSYGDAGERNAAESLGLALFPESAVEILRAIREHPVNAMWGTYCRTIKWLGEQKSMTEDQKREYLRVRFFLPEK
jgi:hypothetical protein